MSFKVGDRVEVIKPAQGVKASENNKVGVGQVLEKDRNAYRVRVEGNQKDWWYPVEDLRPLTTPKRSIKVGDQVRLTGVVESVSNGIVGIDLSEGNKCFLDANHTAALEVIRQPFKRGEVVYNRAESEPEPFVVINDEEDGVVDLTNCRTGVFSEADNPEAFERRSEGEWPEVGA